MASSLPSSRLKPPLLSSSSMPAKGAAEAVTTEVIERLFVCDISRDFYYFWLHFTFVNNQTFFWRWIFQNRKKLSRLLDPRSNQRRLRWIFVDVDFFSSSLRSGPAKKPAEHTSTKNRRARWPSPKDQNRATMLLLPRHIIWLQSASLGTQNFYQYLKFVSIFVVW